MDETEKDDFAGGESGTPGSRPVTGAREPTESTACGLQPRFAQAEAKPDSASDRTDAPKLNAFFGEALEEKPIWAELYGSVHDFFFPAKLPALDLTSKPIPVPDRMAVKANPWSIGISMAVNVAVLLVLLFFVGKKIVGTAKANHLITTNIDVSEFRVPKAATQAGGGGGGGDHSKIDAIRGKLPPREKNPVTPPQVQTVEHPLLPREAAIQVQEDITLPDNPNLPNLGVKNSINVTLASNGRGGSSGIGTGDGGGIGPGHGNGHGPGFGGNTGGEEYRVGGRISEPVVLNRVEAEFSDEARRSKHQGVCIISIIVDAQGHPQNPRVVRALGMGLDEKAIEAVCKYKFKPALKDGKTPVPVPINVAVNFRLY